MWWGTHAWIVLQIQQIQREMMLVDLTRLVSVLLIDVYRVLHAWFVLQVQPKHQELLFLLEETRLVIQHPVS